MGHQQVRLDTVRKLVLPGCSMLYGTWGFHNLDNVNQCSYIQHTVSVIYKCFFYKTEDVLHRINLGSLHQAVLHFHNTSAFHYSMLFGNASLNSWRRSFFSPIVYNSQLHKRNEFAVNPTFYIATHYNRVSGSTFSC